MALINIAGKSYELVLENKAGWNLEAFKGRYSEVLERYDYIVGDWGYNQLRLKGFFKEGSNKATKESAFSFATDYLNEYCNFGCAYFILEKKFDNSVRALDETDDLLVDVDEEYELTKTVSSQVEADKLEVDEQDEPLAEVNHKIVKVQSSNKHHQHQRQQDKQGHIKGSDKQQKRRPFKQRQHKNNQANQGQGNLSNQVQHMSQNVVNHDDAIKEAPKKNKRRNKRPFRHFDRKKNKEQAASSVKE